MSGSGYTAAELAELRLPGLPETKAGVRMLAEREEWPYAERAGRGGRSRVYPATSLPPAAQAALLRRLAVEDEPATQTSTEPRRELADQHRARTLEQVRIVTAIADCVARGGRVGIAIETLAAETGRSKTTIRTWYDVVRKAPRSEWFDLLAPKWKPHVRYAEYDERCYEDFRDRYLSASRPTAAECYRRTVKVAKAEGWSPIPTIYALKRRVQREVPRAARILRREGREAVERLYPAQQRTRTHFGALEALTADGHKFDVRVLWPDGRIERPIMLAFQDLRSSKIVGYRVDRTEHADLVRLAFGDVVERYGIPENVWFDNGRAFAAKRNTGGVAHRFRGRVREEDPVGLFAALGVTIHWTRPYHGQAKPIERAFRDLCDSVARHEAFHGAYTGSNPMTKPWNYGARAVPLETFMDVLAMQIAEHNAREGRTGDGCEGRSFDQVFVESYAESVIRKATEAQRRLFLLAAESVPVRASTCTIHLLGSRYWAPELVELAGQKVVARFDPDHLDRGLHVYRADGSYVSHALLQGAARFDDTASARAHERARREYIRGIRKVADASKTLSPDELDRLHRRHRADEALPPPVALAPTFGGPKPPPSPALEPTAKETARRERSDDLVLELGRAARASGKLRPRKHASGLN